MPKRERVRSRYRVQHVREARAGLITEFDDIADEIRVRTNRMARVIRTVKRSLGSVAKVSEEEAITDILADLRHYCDVSGMSFRKLHTAARARYVDDKTYESAWPDLAGICKTNLACRLPRSD